MRSRLTDQGIIRSYTRLYGKVDEIHKDIQQLLQVLVTPVKLTYNERLILLRLPAHLIKTYFSLQTLKKATAEQVSKLTGKVRATESAYLNQLVTMGFCLKERKHTKFPGNSDMFFWCNVKERSELT